MKKIICLAFAFLLLLSGCTDHKQAQNIKVYTPEPAATASPSVEMPAEEPTATVIPSSEEPTETPSAEPTQTAKPAAETKKPAAVSSSTPKPKLDASSVENSATVYITKSGKKYHRDGCSSLAKSKISTTKSKAVAQGYTPCAKCFK